MTRAQPPSGELATLEALLKDFYQYSTCNERKREIESTLIQFQQLPDSWRFCVAFLKESDDAYVQMFCLIVLDHTVTHRWNSLTSDQKGAFTQFLHELLYSNDKRFFGHFSFVRNKIAKVIIEIGRADWPHAYTDFLENMLKMLDYEEYVATGLLLLRTACEELIGDSSATSAERSDELRCLMLADAPRILDRLTGVLHTLIRMYRSDSTRAPPGSPRRSGASWPSSPTHRDAGDGDALVAFDTTRCMHLDERGLLLSNATFHCLASIFRWVQPAVVKSTLLVQIFQFVSSCMNVVSSVNRNDAARYGTAYCACGQPIEDAAQISEGSVNALSCLTEFLSRNYTPPDFRSFLSQAAVYTHVTLCRLCGLDWSGERDALANRMFLNDISVIYRDAEPIAVSVKTPVISLNKSFSTDLDSLRCALHASDYGPPRNATSAQTDARIALVRPSYEFRRSDDLFIEEFNNYLRVFLGGHFRFLELDQIESADGAEGRRVSIRDLLAAFYVYTLSQPVTRTNSGFSLCLEIWQAVLNTINAEQPLSTRHAALRSDYTDMLVCFANQLTMKIQYRFNAMELQEFDADRIEHDSQYSSTDESNSSASESSLDAVGVSGANDEWRSFVIRCTDTLGKLATLLPDVTYAIVSDLFVSHAREAMSLGRYFISAPDSSAPAGDLNGNPLSSGVQFRLPSEFSTSGDSSRTLRNALRDLATLTRAVVRLVPDQLCGNQLKFESRFSCGELLVTELVNLAKLLAAKRVYKAKCVFDSESNNDSSLVVTSDTRSLVYYWVLVHGECLQALAVVCGAWLSQFHSLCVASENSGLLDSIDGLFTALLDECVAPVFTLDAPSRLLLPATHLLLAVVRCKPSRLLDSAGFRTLVERAAVVDNVAHYSDSVLASLYRAVIIAFTQSESTQSVLFDRFVVSVSTPLFQAAACAEEIERDPALRRDVQPRILSVLLALNEIVSSLQGGSPKLKQLAARSLDSAVQSALRLVLACADSLELLNSLANFVLNFLRTLRSAVRPDLIDLVWCTFVSLLDGSKLAQAVSDSANQQAEAACTALTRFIELLCFLVQDGAFKARLSDALRIALDRVYAAIVASDAFLFIRPVFYSFIQDVFTHHWHFFFKQQFTFSAALSKGEEAESEAMAEHQEQLQALLNIVFDGLINSQPTVFRAALSTLETMHSRHRFYSRKIFRSGLLDRFCRLLLSYTVDRKHAALQDEICLALFNVVSALEFSTFRMVILPQFVASEQYQSDGLRLSAEQRVKLCAAFGERDSDLPSFTTALCRFAHDLRFYTQANATQRDGGRTAGIFQISLPSF